MKIQIYKPCFNSKFVSPDSSVVFVNVEIKNLVELLQSSGNLVQVLSPSDIKFNKIYNADWKILINGRTYFKGDELDERVRTELPEIHRIFDGSGNQAQIITDWKIVKKNNENLRDIRFDKLLTQSPSIPDYVEYEKLFLFNNSIATNGTRMDKVVYIGNQRGGARDADISKYLLNSGVDFDLFGNWELSQSKGKVLAKDVKSLLTHYKFGLCLTENLYREKQHRTPRIFEYMLSGVIPFVDWKYPVSHELVSNDDFRIVRHAEELEDKMKYLNKHSAQLQFMRGEGYRECMKYFDGKIVKDKIMKVLSHGS